MIVTAGWLAALFAQTGPFWSIVVPALLLAFATFATYLLYRHFARSD